MLLESKCVLKGVFTGFWLFMETGTVLPGTGTGVRKHFFFSLSFFFLFLGCVCVCVKWAPDVVAHVCNSII